MAVSFVTRRFRSSFHNPCCSILASSSLRLCPSFNPKKVSPFVNYSNYYNINIHQFNNMSSSDSTSETLDSSDAVLDLGALVAASRDLARRSGEIVRGIYESGDLQVIDKALGKSVLSKSDSLKAQDPTTLADVTAERLIIGSIKKQFPGLRVCGEEGETKISDDEICVPNMVFDKDKQVPNQYDRIKVKDCCVWVGM